MKNLKNQKGITLVALVVTIIVLLILAGVSLSLVAGGDGILGKATNAVTETERAAAREQAGLLLAEYQMDWYDLYYVQGKIDEAGEKGTYVSTQVGTNGKTSDYFVEISGTTINVYKGESKPATGDPIITGTFDTETGAATFPKTTTTTGGNTTNTQG